MHTLQKRAPNQKCSYGSYWKRILVPRSSTRQTVERGLDPRQFLPKTTSRLLESTSFCEHFLSVENGVNITALHRDYFLIAITTNPWHSRKHSDNQSFSFVYLTSSSILSPHFFFLHVKGKYNYQYNGFITIVFFFPFDLDTLKKKKKGHTTTANVRKESMVGFP